jgi:hypothetical protein
MTARRAVAGMTYCCTLVLYGLRKEPVAGSQPDSDLRTTRDALKRLSDLLGGPQHSTEATTKNAATEMPDQGIADDPQTAA